MVIKKRTLILTVILSIILGSLYSRIISFAADNNEPNDTFGTAKVLTFQPNLFSVNIDSYISTSTDIDWFKIYVDHVGLYSATLTNTITDSPNSFGTLPGDYDIMIYDYNNNPITGSYKRGTSWEGLYFNTTYTGYYYVKIYGYSGAYSGSSPYRLIINHGDALMVTEANRFLNYSGQGFYERDGVVWQSRGVAYGYGSKDSLTHYHFDIISAYNYANRPFDGWEDYNFPTYERPGRKDGDVSGTKNCGIDCSGFLQRCAENAGTRYKIARDTPLQGADGLTGGWVQAKNMGSYSSTITALTTTLQTGDIAYWETHCIMISKVNVNDYLNSKIIEASGADLDRGGRVVKERDLSFYDITSKIFARFTQ